MRVSDTGEFGLVERIRKLAGAGAPRSAGVVLGIGDDAAVLRARPGEDVALTTDAFVEGVHFRLDTESARSVGRRVLAANLSDLAALGARPLGCTLALALPAHSEVRQVLALVRGLLDVARAHRCPLVGGNITRARQLSLTVAAQGAVLRGRALRRSAGRAGDRLFVTGTLGGAALRRAKGQAPRTPAARLCAGRALARLPGVGACIDVSDGLLADLEHLCRASGLGARLDVDALPRPRGFDAACRLRGLRPERLLLSGGDDLELLFSMRQGAPSASALGRKLQTPVSEIGVLRRGRGVRVPGVALRGPAGWTHF